MVLDYRAGRNPYDEVRSGSALPIASLAVRAVPCSIQLLILAIQEGIQRRIGLDDDIPALASATAVRSSFGDVRFPPETEAAAAALSGLHDNFGLIYEFQWSIGEPAGTKIGIPPSQRSEDSDVGA